MGPHDCPLFCSDKSTMYQMLQSLSLWELDSQMRTALSLLSLGERTMYNFEHYVTCHDDREGRIKFLLRLIKDEKIAVLHIPPNFENDSTFNEVLGRRKRNFSFLFSEEAAPAAEPEVLTDEMEVVSGTVEVTNPRWEHKDTDKKQNSPEKVSFGDTIILMADITNYPEGASVTYDIYDTKSDPPQLVDSATGKHEGGVGKGEWKVTDKSGKCDDQEFAFEAIVRSKASEKKEIPLIFAGYVFSC